LNRPRAVDMVKKNEAVLFSVGRSSETGTAPGVSRGLGVLKTSKTWFRYITMVLKIWKNKNRPQKLLILYQFCHQNCGFLKGFEYNHDQQLFDSVIFQGTGTNNSLIVKY
jgi:hypothetical protein